MSPPGRIHAVCAAGWVAPGRGQGASHENGLVIDDTQQASGSFGIRLAQMTGTGTSTQVRQSEPSATRSGGGCTSTKSISTFSGLPRVITSYAVSFVKARRPSDSTILALIEYLFRELMSSRLY